MKNLIHLYLNSLKLNVSYLAKSKSNLTFMFLGQVVYYLAQLIFWSGVLNANNSQFTQSPINLYGFLVTFAFVDNFYLMFIGSGTLKVQPYILRGTLDTILVRPIHPVLYFSLFHPNLGHAAGMLISIIALIMYYIHFNISAAFIIVHLLAMILGAATLSGISFLFRISCFWTKSIVAIRNSNPSFKIMVRPFQSFNGGLKMFLLFAFPALFITGVPTELLTGGLPVYWLGIALIANIVLWSVVVMLWTIGVKRYCLKAI